jgi:DNA-binding transcriptional MerR regulator
MKMQELERKSGLGRETIRYYIGLGLLPEPVRPKPNVAVYSEEHVRRLAVIKRLQAERYLPLSFIKTLLDRPSGGEVGAIPGLESYLAGELGYAEDAAPVCLDEAARRTGLPVEEIRTLAAVGVLFIGPEGLSPPDLAVARAWGQVRGAGFTPEQGFFAEDASVYAEALAPLAAREVDRFLTRVPGGLPAGEAQALARQGVALVNGLIAAMRANYILRALASPRLPTEPER